MTRRPRRLDLRQLGPPVFYVLGGLAALNLAFYLVLTQPADRDYALRSEETQSYDKVNRKRTVVKKQESYLTAVQQATEDLTQLREEVLATRNKRLVEVQQELARLCDQFGIDLRMVGSDSELLLDEELDRFVMTVPLEGNYANLRKFLHAIEISDKFLIVERVSLARGKMGGNQLDLNIGLATYFSAPEELVRRKKLLGRGRRG